MAFLVLFCGLSAAYEGTIKLEDIGRQIELLEANGKSCGPISVWYCLRRLGYHVLLLQLAKKRKVVTCNCCQRDTRDG